MPRRKREPDPDDIELTDEELSSMRPAHEVLSPEFLAEHRRLRMARSQPQSVGQSNPVLAWDELHASNSFRELFRYKKAGNVRIYNLRALSEHKAELWVVTARGKSRQLATFTTQDEASAFLDSVEQELRAGGWTSC
jgi:hypothetical protein